MRNILSKLLLILCIISLEACQSSIVSQEKRIEAAQANASLSTYYLSHNNMTEAKTKLYQAKQQASNNPIVIESEAIYANKTHKTLQANELYQQAIARNPCAIFMNNYAIFLCQHQHIKEALQFFSQALSVTHNLTTKQAIIKNQHACQLMNVDENR